MYPNKEQLHSELDQFGHTRAYDIGVTQEKDRKAYGRPTLLLDADAIFAQIVAQYGEQPNADAIAAEIAADAFQNSSHIGPIEGAHNPIAIETPEQRENRLAMELWGGNTTTETEMKGASAYDLANPAAALNEQFGLAA